ncbi:MAG TPA: Dabb family protein [Pseudonocardiaceae bacterium]
MIYHFNRVKLKEGVTPQQFEQAVQCLRDQGRIPVVKSFIVGPEHGSDFDWGAVFVLEDLDAYAEYLNHPAHARLEQIGLPLLTKFDSYDVSDDLDPVLGDKIADLQKRNYEAKPELVTLMADVESHSGVSALPGES